MPAKIPPMDGILGQLQERAKELQCLYRVDETLSRWELPRDEVLRDLLGVLPEGWRFPSSCQASIALEGKVYKPLEWVETPWVLREPVTLDGETIGEVAIGYREERPAADDGPFLEEERRLIRAIAERLRYFAMQRRLKRAYRQYQSAIRGAGTDRGGASWSVILEFLRSTDRTLLLRMTRRMINYLCWNGVKPAEALLREFAPEPRDGELEDNRPVERRAPRDLASLPDRTFRIASEHLAEDEIMHCIQGWIREQKASFLYEALENLDTPLSELVDALLRYQSLNLGEEGLPLASRTGLHVNLLRRFFSDRLDFVHRARDFVRIEDFYGLARHVVSTPRGLGKLGGKSAGLFAGQLVVQRSAAYENMLADVRVPKTWYVASDALLHFIRYNDLEDVYNRKYREVDQLRLEYPHLVQVFKNSRFPPELVMGLSVALDDFEGRPIIVRSSSLLEDQGGHAFSGKYKSLFLANQGSKRERLAALQDAIAEVYASVFGPDPIEYRAERGLLDVHEEMGIMIQEVVGSQVGRYFLPSWAGVAMTNNEFRWSPRIRREDGLVRLVAGLGTRAVDRTGDDYPVLLAPGQPRLRVNVTADEVVRYSPTKVDVLNLETNDFETLDLLTLLREYGEHLPGIRRMVSLVEHDHIRKPTGLGLELRDLDFVVNFAGLIDDTPFVSQIRTLLTLLEDKLGTPVDIEFASDGSALYLLQCRPQSFGTESTASPIPRDVPEDRVLFSAVRHVSNGRVPDLTHLVYVDPAGYGRLTDHDALRRVGRAVGRLNALLPKRQFALMGPGRWGSRGDIHLGVQVTYSDLCNASLLIEIARAKGRYVPDLSFGTHFFQDLVEAEIRYLPLYPDDDEGRFNHRFFEEAPNALERLLPEYADLSHVVRVIDVPAATGGLVARVLMDADANRALAMLVPPAADRREVDARPRVEAPVDRSAPDEHWKWRLRVAQRLGAQLDPERFDVRGLYVFGSTKNATAGPASDLDLIVHVGNDPEKRRDLLTWLEGWSLCLAEMNYLRTGFRRERLLDVQLVTDEDLSRRSAYAAKIGAVTDPARPIPLPRRV